MIQCSVEQSRTSDLEGPCDLLLDMYDSLDLDDDKMTEKLISIKKLKS